MSLNTWACINAILNSSPENAIIKLKGNKPNRKNKNDLKGYLFQLHNNKTIIHYNKKYAR